MATENGKQFEFPPGLPVPNCSPGTNLLVSGPSRQGAREIALDLLTMGSNREGVLLVTTDSAGSDVLERIAALPQPVDRTMLGIVDATTDRADEHDRFTEHTAPIDGPGDLTHIEMEFSLLYEKLQGRDPSGIRVGMLSVTALLEQAPLRDVSRFFHMLTGRIIATDDLGVFLVDSTTVDEQTVETLGQFCDGHIQVRETGDGGLDLSVSGLPDQTDSWSTVGYEVLSLEQENGATEQR